MLWRRVQADVVLLHCTLLLLPPRNLLFVALPILISLYWVLPIWNVRSRSLVLVDFPHVVRSFPWRLGFCSWCTWFKQQRCHHSRIRWTWKCQLACVYYLHTLNVSTDPYHFPWAMGRLWVFWEVFSPLRLPWGAPSRTGCVWPLCPISRGGAEKCTTNQQDL